MFLALRIDFIDTHVIGQQAVHADIAEPRVAFYFFQLLLPVGAQSLIGAAGAVPFNPERDQNNA